MNEKYRPVRAIQAAPGPTTRVQQAGPAALRATLALLSVAVLLVSGVAYAVVGRLESSIASAGGLSLGDRDTGDAADGATDILLVGSDSRTDAQGNPMTQEELDALRAGEESGAENTDTIMVVRIPNDGSSATAVSIPRDTYIHDDELDNTKINGVYGAYKNARAEELRAEGVTDEAEIERQSKDAGRQALIHAVSELTGVEVDHYAEVGLLGFVLLTDAIGGVDVCLNEAVEDEYSGASFTAGVQTLDGIQALAFVRQRHGLPRGDLDRVVRQQAFMASMANKVLSAGTLANPSRLNELRGAVERSVVIDDGWDIMQFATQLSDLAGGNVTFSTIPVTSIDGTGDYGESIVTVDVDEVHAFMAELLGEEDSSTVEVEDPSESSSSSDEWIDVPQDSEIHVLNAGAISGLAGSVAGLIEEHGLDITYVGNAQAGLYSESVVVAADASDEGALALAEHLGGLPVITSSSLDSTSYVVVTADDYEGPTGQQISSSTMDGESTYGSSSSSSVVGQEGSDAGDSGESPTIDAGGNSPRCVN